MLIAIFALVKAILFPNTQIIVAAGQKTQAKEVIEKISHMMTSSGNLRREISYINSNGQDPVINFHNGSWIRTVAARDGARGKRSNLLIIDEYRMVPANIINTVLKKFQSAPRLVGYIEKEPFKSMNNKEKMKYLDRNQEVYLSSAWFKAHESWERVVDYADKMSKGEKYFVCQLPYQLAIKEGLLNPEQVRDEMNESSFNEIMWEMEMNALFWGEHENSYFTFEEISKNRTLKRAYYPKNITENFSDSSIQPPLKKPGEIRVVVADIATMSNKDSDNSIYAVGRLIPRKDGYERQIMYKEATFGQHSETQAVRIRELFEDFDCDYMVLDTMGVGIGVYDELVKELTNERTGEVYPPLSCMNNEELANRCPYPNAPKVIYSIRGTAELNHRIAIALKDALRRGKIKFPVHEGETQDVIDSIKGSSKFTVEQRAELLAPYVQTSLMTNEIINLEQEITETGIIRLRAQRSARKDRYSAISYLNYFASEFEVQDRKRNRNHEVDITRFFKSRPARPF